MIAAVVDWDKLLDVVWTAALAGVGGTVVFAVAVYGVTRSSDMLRAERTAAGAAYAVLGIAGLLATLLAIIYAVVLITSK